MSDISTKLTYLQTTKQLLKTEINKINNVLDDNSTFRSYPQELFNGYLDVLNNGTDTLWNNLEKVSQTGTEAVLDGVETAPIKMVLNGNTNQDTTSGKNKFSTDYLDSYTYDTYTQLSKNSFEFNATTLWKTSRFKIPCKSNTDYYFNLKQDLSVSTRNVYIVIRGVQTGEIIYELYVGYLKAFNSGENTELMINIQSGAAALSGKIYNIQLEEGTSPTEFEEYTGGQPSPSPDYPQQVKVVKGENVVSVQGKNLFDEVTELGRLQSSSSSPNFGEEVASTTQLRAKNYIQVKPNTTYFCYFGSTVSGAQVFVFAYDENYNAITSYGYKTFTNTTITTPEGARYIRFYMNAQYGTTYNNDICIVEGTSTDFVPYSKTDYPINLGDIELCKIDNYNDFPFKAINGNEYYDSLTEEQKNALVYGKWYMHKEIGKVVLDGSESGWKKRGSSTNSYIIIQRSFRVGGNICMSDKFIYSGSYDGQFEHILVNSSWNENLITIDTSRLTENSLNGAKQWLSTNQPNMYYPLATPTEEEITNTTLIEQLEAISKAKSVKDKTYITQINDELPFILDVEAIKEYSVE